MVHMDGNIWLLMRSLQLTSFQAYKLRVTHLYQLKQHSILVSVGQDEHGINPLVSVFFGGKLTVVLLLMMDHYETE